VVDEDEAEVRRQDCRWRRRRLGRIVAIPHASSGRALPVQDVVTPS
jgi:hypothetical protein